MNSDFLKHLAQTTAHPIGLQIERAEGCYLYDPDGNKYLDFVGGIAVNNLGHGHPVVIEAVKSQVDNYMHVMPYGEYVFDVQVALAKTLISHCPENLDQCYFVNSGTEAIEASMKLAKRATGRYELVSFKGAYHGATQGSLSLSSSAVRKNSIRPLLPGVKHLDFNDRSGLLAITEKTAGVVIEVIQGDAGVIKGDFEFIRELSQRCAEVGAILIFDEVQTGMGRTGSLFAFEQYNVSPDILVLGKALGAGLPLACFIANQKLMACLKTNPPLGHITTFGGNPVACAAALSGLKLLTEGNIISEVNQKAKLLKSLIDHKLVREVRFAGLMFAIELDSAAEVQYVIDYCRSKGLLSFYFLSAPNCFRLQPPLTVSEEQISTAATTINEALVASKLIA